MNRTNRFTALGSPAPKDTSMSTGARTMLARSTRIEAPLLKSISERLGGINLTEMLAAVDDVIEHIKQCIVDQKTRPNFEPTNRFLQHIDLLHISVTLLAATSGAETCTQQVDERRSFLRKEGSTQTDPETPPPLSYAAIVSQHIPPETPPPLSYAAIVSQHIPPNTPPTKKSDLPPMAPPKSRTKSTAPQSKSAERGSSAHPPKQKEKKPPTSSLKARTSQKERLPQSGRAVVVHGIAVMKKLGKVRDWMEKANPWMGRIVAARWLVNKERREGKKTSSIVIYLEGEVESDSQTPVKIRLSGKWHHSCLYDWDRTTKVDGKGKERDVEEMDMTA